MVDSFVGEGDPAGSRFDMYAIAPPVGKWGYVLDDFGIEYRRGGRWPFRRGPGDGGAAVVRLAPDTAFQSWRNEYVLLGPGRRGRYDSDGATGWANAALCLYVRPQGLGGIVVRAWVELDLHTEIAKVAADCPGQLVGQAEMKAQRLLSFLLEHKSRAGRARRPRLVTAHDEWVRRGQR